MLEHYFTKPQTADRIKESWIGQSIEKYVVWLSDQGYAARTVHRRVPLLRRFGEVAWDLGARELKDLPDYVDSFIDTWIREHKRRAAKKRDMSSIRKDIRRPVEQFLKIVVKCYTGNSKRKREPFSNTVPDFFSYLCEQRGLGQISIRRYFLHLGRFENYLAKISFHHLSALSPIILSSFISDISRFLGKWAMRELCCVLRVFLRYLYQERVIARDLSHTIEPPQIYRLSDIPRSISWDEVAALLETVDRRTPTGKRDYGILLLLVTYGLRAREVSKLTLDDIDWKRQRLYILERKAGPSTAYPLSVSVIDIQKVTKLDDPIFVSRQGRALTRFGIYKIVVRRTKIISLKGSNTKTRLISPHVFRHTTAVHLLESGVEPNVIRSWLGHVDLDTTYRYAEINIRAKEAALKICEPPSVFPEAFPRKPHWRDDENLLKWLDTL